MAMPQIGDKIHGHAIGRTRNTTWVYFACPDCGYTRWVQPVQIRTSKGICYKCAGHSRQGSGNIKLRGANNPAWKGGRVLVAGGYIRVSIYPEDPLFPMAKVDKGNVSGSIYEHRLVMARHLERCLESWEVVHHINGDRTDNRIENLELLPNKVSHIHSINLQREVNKLQERVRQLELRVMLLEAERVLMSKS